MTPCDSEAGAQGAGEWPKSLDVLLVSTESVGLAPSDTFNDPERCPVSEPVPLLPALNLRLDGVEGELAEKVIDACEPKGSVGVRQYSCRWGFFREDPPRKSEQEPWSWDPDRAIYTAMALSRIVQPNVICTEYAARIIAEDGTSEIRPGPVTGQSADAWLHESIWKRWLTKTDAETLAALLTTYWPLRDALPGRLRRALWNHEYVAQTHDPNVRLVIASTALEALVHTDQFKSTAQFCRVAPLAAELGVPFSESDAKKAYSLRSHVAHGDRLATLLDPNDPKERATQEANIESLLLALEEILRRGIRRGIENPAFRAVFEDPALIRARWPT